MNNKKSKGRSPKTYENKIRKMTKLYNSNENIQRKYKTLDEFLSLLKKSNINK